MSMERGTAATSSVIPADFEPTPEEKSLLAIYATVRLYEKERDKIKEEAAKAKLRAKNELFRRREPEKGLSDAEEDYSDKEDDNSEEHNTVMPAKKKKRSRSSSANAGNFGGATDTAEGDLVGQDSEDEDYDDSDDDIDHAEKKARRRKEKLKEMKLQLSKEREEEDERVKHLTDGGAVDAIMMENDLVLKKKKKNMSFGAGPSLLDSIENQATPPHEFSKSLGMPKASIHGKQIFPSPTSSGESWSPPPTATNPLDGDLCVDLSGFDLSQVQSGNGNNTIAIKFVAPQESNRFSINITESKNNNYADVLFHFNPRQRQKGGQLVINDKQDGIWGQGINVPLSILPLVFGQTASTLILQINGEGFDVFLDGKHCARLEHRKQLSNNKSTLKIQFPSTDDYGSPENWTVHKIWWGHKKPMFGDLTNVPGVNISSYIHPKKLFISSLTKIYSEAEVELRRAELERAFRKYGGAQGCIVKVPTNSTFAFVEVETTRMADTALREMSTTYTMSRARRTKHEMIQEQRNATGKEDKSEWD